jgi:hypothetical protein
LRVHAHRPEARGKRKAAEPRDAGRFARAENQISLRQAR